MDSAALTTALKEARAHHRAGRLLEAEVIYRRVLTAQPDHPDALHLLGVVAYQMERHDTAVELIGTAIARMQDAARDHSDLDNALKGQGRLDEAVAADRRPLALKPDFPEAHYNLGLALHALGRLEEAVVAYRKAVALDPRHVIAYKNIFRILFELGNKEAATKQYNVWKSKNRRNVIDKDTSVFIFSSSRMNDSIDYLETPYIGELNDVSVLTSHWLVLKGDKIFYEELLNRNIENVPFIEAVGSDGSVFSDIPEESLCVEDPCILLGGSTQYYHWLIDYFPRLAIIERFNKIKEIPLLVNDNLSDFQKQSLEVLEIPFSRLIKVQSPARIRCNHLFVPTIFSHRYFLHPEGVLWLRRSFGCNIEDNHLSSRKLLFVSRQDATRRRLLNEHELIDALAPFGFQVVIPGKLHFMDQIRVFSVAKLIVGPHGAGLTNMIFAPDDVQIIELQHGNYPNACMERLARSFGISCETIFGEAEKTAYDSTPFQKQMADFTVDVETVVNAVRSKLTN